MGGQAKQWRISVGEAARRNCGGEAVARKAATERSESHAQRSESPAELLPAVLCAACAMKPRKCAAAMCHLRSGGPKNFALAYLIHLSFSLV